MWNSKDTAPDVEIGTEVEYWIAVKTPEKVYTFIALYQNKPLRLDEEGEPLDDWCLHDDCGKPLDSVGWVSSKVHYEYDDYFEKLDFHEEYELLGWTEYTPPKWEPKESYTYFVSFTCGSGNGHIILYPDFKIRTGEDVNALRKYLEEQIGTPACIVNWIELEG